MPRFQFGTRPRVKTTLRAQTKIFSVAWLGDDVNFVQMQEIKLGCKAEKSSQFKLMKRK